ncbi:hypothetical protein CDD83_9432 [Cordyceps sp. RAO-2017]|nr:hypothetical protein CDD83_9432 [Cordyceps sp. RAO-2017]
MKRFAQLGLVLLDERGKIYSWPQLGKPKLGGEVERSHGWCLSARKQVMHKDKNLGVFLRGGIFVLPRLIIGSSGWYGAIESAARKVRSRVSAASIRVCLWGV